MIRRPPRSTLSSSSAASDVYKRQGRGGLSPATVRRIHATLHRALKDAVRWNLLQKNPVDAADPPRLAAADAEMKVWNAKELKVFLAAERASRLYPLWLTLATTGHAAPALSEEAASQVAALLLPD